MTPIYVAIDSGAIATVRTYGGSNVWTEATP